MMSSIRKEIKSRENNLETIETADIKTRPRDYQVQETVVPVENIKEISKDKSNQTTEKGTTEPVTEQPAQTTQETQQSAPQQQQSKPQSAPTPQQQQSASQQSPQPARKLKLKGLTRNKTK